MADPAALLEQLRAAQGPKPAQKSAGQMLGELRAARGGSAREVVYVTDNGGQVTKGPEGMSYRDDVWATSNPEAIERIMAGESPGAVSMSGWDRDTIAKAEGPARAQEFLRGVPFVGSYTDELMGAVKGEDAAGNARALSSAMQRERPGETLALNMSGAVTSTAPLAVVAAPQAAAAAPTSRAGQAALSTLAGGTLGATEGAVYQYGEDGDAATGAAVGGTLGAVLGLAAPYANQGLKNLGEWFKKSDVKRIASELGLSTQAATIIRNAFRSGDSAQARQAIDAAGPSAMLADAGQPARELLDAATTAGGDAGMIARQAVEERAGRSSSELTKALDDALGGAKGRSAAIGDLRSGTSQARKDAYDKAYSDPIDYASGLGRRIESLMPRIPESAIKAANDLMSVRGVQSKQILAEIGDDRKVTLSQMPDVQQLHYILQGLDDAIEKAKTGLGRGTTKSTALSELRQQLGNALKAAVPSFKAAQDVAADTIKRENAIDMGWELLKPKTKTDVLSQALHNASKAEKEAMAEGVRGYIEDAMENVSRVVSDANVDAREAMKVVRDLSSRANKTKLTRLLGKQKADELFAAVERETIALELRAAIAQNSKTSIRDSIKQGVKDQVEPGALRTLLAGEPVNATKRMVQVVTGETSEAQTLREMGIFEEIARVLTQVRGAGAKRALSSIEAAISGQKITDAQAAQIAQVLTASGLLTGQSQATRAITQ